MLCPFVGVGEFRGTFSKVYKVREVRLMGRYVFKELRNILDFSRRDRGNAVIVRTPTAGRGRIVCRRTAEMRGRAPNAARRVGYLETGSHAQASRVRNAQ